MCGGKGGMMSRDKKGKDKGGDDKGDDDKGNKDDYTTINHYVHKNFMCDPQTRATALSVPLFSGSQTVGVLLVSPLAPTERDDGSSTWTLQDREQVSRAAQSLSLALSMDSERSALQEQTNQFRETLSDSVHQVKNPLQALRTYGKLLQRRIANSEDGYESRFEFGQTPQLLALADQLMVQSDRVVDLLLPMDSLVAETAPSLYLNPSAEPEHTVLTWWHDTSGRIPWSNETEDFSNDDKQGRQGAADIRPISNSSEYETASLSSPQSENGHRSASSSTWIGDNEMEMAFIQDVLEPILSGFEVIASEQAIGFVVIEDDDDLPGVVVSPKSLQEAVVNVIDKAFKYVVLPKPGCGFTRNPSPRVRVRLRANRKPFASGVTVLVEDNGPGIPSKEQGRIFERGFRGETTSSIDGSGIGLDITNSLISCMGGVLEVAQGDENGSLDGAIIKLVLFRNSQV